VVIEEQDILLYIKSAPSYEGSQLLSIIESSMNKLSLSEGVNPSNDIENQSNHGIIHDIPGTFETPQHDKEQSYTTALRSLSSSFKPRRNIKLLIVTPEGNGKEWERDTPPHSEVSMDKWEQLERALNHCDNIANDGQSQAIESRQELKTLKLKVANSYNHATYTIKVIARAASCFLTTMSSQTLSTQCLFSATSPPKKWAKKAPSSPPAPKVPSSLSPSGPRPDAR
jgi:hypothetical protein